MDDQADLQAQEAVDLAHPLAVALGQVVVDRDDVDAPARQRVEVGGEGGYQRFALTGLHLGDASSRYTRRAGAEPFRRGRPCSTGRTR